jgi:hypothetical protein
MGINSLKKRLKRDIAAQIEFALHSGFSVGSGDPAYTIFE